MKRLPAWRVAACRGRAARPSGGVALGEALGDTLGDALGAGCEMMTRDLIATTYGRVEAYIPTSLQKFGGENQRIPGCYTDDTEMALGLALSLTEMRGDVGEDRVVLCGTCHGFFAIVFPISEI